MKSSFRSSASSSDQVPGPDRADRKPDDAERHHVLPALTGSEDEEPVAAMVDRPRHEHHADHAGSGERGEQAEEQRDAGADLGDAGQPGVELGGLHAHRAEPARRAVDVRADVVDAVGEHHRPHAAAQEEQGEVDGVGVGHRPSLSRELG